MKREELKRKYQVIAKKLKRTPSVSDCVVYGITRAMIRHHFGNITNLQKASNLKPTVIINQEKLNIYKILGVKSES